MGGVVKGLFGGSKPASSKTTSQTTYSPEEQARRNEVQTNASNIYRQTQGSYTPGNAPIADVVPFSQDTLNAQDWLRAFAGGTGQDITNQALGAMNFGFNDAIDPNSNPAIQDMLAANQRRIQQSYSDPGGVLSQIRTQAMTNADSGSSTRQGIAEGIAAAREGQQIADSGAAIVNNAYNQGLDTFEKTMAFSPNLMNLALQPALTLGGVGTQIEGQAQAQENVDASRQQYALDAPWMGLQNFANIVYGGSNPITTTRSTAPTTGGSGGLSNAIGLASLAATLFS